MHSSSTPACNSVSTCEAAGCPRIGGKRCSLCVKHGIQGGVFCGDACFRANWKSHKETHHMPPVPTCARIGCERPAPKVCKGCHDWGVQPLHYCSSRCLKASFPTHNDYHERAARVSPRDPWRRSYNPHDPTLRRHTLSIPAPPTLCRYSVSPFRGRCNRRSTLPANFHSPLPREPCYKPAPRASNRRLDTVFCRLSERPSSCANLKSVILSLPDGVTVPFWFHRFHDPVGARNPAFPSVVQSITRNLAYDVWHDFSFLRSPAPSGAKQACIDLDHFIFPDRWSPTMMRGTASTIFPWAPRWTSSLFSASEETPNPVVLRQDTAWSPPPNAPVVRALEPFIFATSGGVALTRHPTR